MGSFLHHVGAVDPTLIMELSRISSQKYKPTEPTIKQLNHFLEYMETYPHTVISYYKYDNNLKIHAGALYLTESKGCSIVGGH